MSDFSTALTVTSGALKTQATRLRHVAENISNADTPGYRRKMITFRTETDPNGVTMVEPGKLQLDRSELKQIYDPAHPLADDAGHYDGSNVDMMIEIADAREAQRSYEANLKMFDQTRQMSAALMELLRK
ncbi:MAG: flagellar basal body rod protein FlgC [Rhodobacteraceae bacterium]|nr:flagellar basal body rod protein FlgC [Paracoccaceae bacterium]MAY46210.1 flagellar basal body rod protein FlgC [Paracoccaceae bacterium]QEW22751.1 Putative proximal rod protein [Marinibacterium anthonyi]|tara:strand:+ start:120 stop:509 length:390 start_codon:yes stop_codon:yes gene_type:complete